jgi:hypothetical protein
MFTLGSGTYVLLGMGGRYFTEHVLVTGESCPVVTVSRLSTHMASRLFARAVYFPGATCSDVRCPSVTATL